MVFVTYISTSLFLGIHIAYSLPVPPNDPPKSFVSRPGTKIQSTSKPTIFPLPEPSALDVQDTTNMYGTAETISIPSVNEEKNGRGWMNNIAGPPLDTFTTLRQAASQDTTQLYPQYLSLNKQPFKGAKFQQDSNLARLKTALDDGVEDSDSEDLAYTQNIDYNFSDGEELTARFKLATQDRRVTLDFSDADDRGIDIDLEDNESYEEEEEKQPDYDPVRDPFYGDYPRRSPLRHKLRELLERPLYKPLPSWQGKPENLLINPNDSSFTAREKMQYNLQPIPEGPSLLEMPSTIRGGDALPHLRKKMGALKPKFLPQGRESLQLPSPGLNHSSQVASINNESSNMEDQRDPQISALTLPEITSSFRPPKENNVPKLTLRPNEQIPGL
ncbi:hypothetical protein AOL_s00083g83 [Orbilia oligospora ATCC 24927]|uniref:Uncharacterized protein n=1 Tax=Arthrobotrys oligospora (strain ATCC 24927 / CBS 115.81 / DSM 1491) TaxID=756982 RepID=G1XGF2_ARTOA|nr:hypothetical protein AOL_s00083g83 [Orbilia oligospora ATCC 24927]EGX47575.1 hypothetical protein AOL_s00083g83 [Orbilia oligospora ATCC 24927]